MTEAQTAALTVGDVNVGEQLTEVVQSTEETLQGITDAASAEAAVPELNDINTRLEELSGTVGQLPDDAKKVLADVLGERVTELKTLAEKLAGQAGRWRRREAGARADHREAGGLGAGAGLAHQCPSPSRRRRDRAAQAPLGGQPGGAVHFFMAGFRADPA